MSPGNATQERRVSSDDRPTSAESIADVLERMREKGVRLWLDNGQLRYKAPKGALTQEEIERLRLSKVEIVAYVEKADLAQTAEPQLEPRPCFDHAPVAYSQLAHWRLNSLNVRSAVRQIVSATRLRGRLNVDVLRQAVDEIVRRQDALRTQIVILDAVPTQRIMQAAAWNLQVQDLTVWSEDSRDLEVGRRIERLVLEPIDVAVDPLVGMELLKLSVEEHVLVVAMEHMISDARSMDILLRDLFTSYRQILIGQPLSLPPVSAQFADFAVWQRNVHKRWLKTHGEHWTDHFAGCRRLRFPVDVNLTTQDASGWGVVPIRIERDLRKDLREWCRSRRTTLVLSVFTAYVGLVLRWCSVREAVILFVTDGRVNPKVENTIGFFSQKLFLRIGLCESDSFVDLMNSITDEFCRAYEHADFGYMEAQGPNLEFTHNTAFNWLPQASEVELPDVSMEHAVTCSRVPFAHPMLKDSDSDNEPAVLLVDTEEGITGDVYFPLNRFSVGAMERFASNFAMFLETLLRHPETPVKNLRLL